MPIPVVDLFAGPGGLNEGFSAAVGKKGERIFKTAISVEFEKCAHRTLELRALYRHLKNAGKLNDYYRYVRGDITREQLFESAKEIGVAAQKEALLATLGKSEAEDEKIEQKIKEALAEFKDSEFVLIGGPPCQAYSLAGRSRRAKEKREKFESDHKHVLYREYLRIVAKFRPALFVMENVTGLLSASLKGRHTFQQIQDDLRSAGYDLHPITPEVSDEAGPEDPRAYIVRAEEYGVPQCRARVFILGLRSDLGLVPQSLSRPEAPKVTVDDVIRDLPEIRSRLSKEPDYPDTWRSAIQQLLQYEFKSLDKNVHLGMLSNLNEMPLERPLGAQVLKPTRKKPKGLADWFADPNLGVVLNHGSRGHMRSDLMRYFFWSQYAQSKGRSPTLSEVPHFLRPKHKNISGNAKEAPFADRFRVQVKDKPSTTITSHISKDGHYYIHPDPTQCRSLTVREAARLQTFPDNYLFEGAPTDQYRQVGNAVPPYLASKIADVAGSILGIS